jgi:hypothetical protein
VRYLLEEVESLLSGGGHRGGVRLGQQEAKRLQSRNTAVRDIRLQKPASKVAKRDELGTPMLARPAPDRVCAR